MRIAMWAAWMSLGLGWASEFRALVPLVGSERGETTRLVLINPDSAAQQVALTGFSADGAVVFEEERVLGPHHRTGLWVAPEVPTAWVEVTAEGQVIVLVASETPQAQFAAWAAKGIARSIDVSHVARELDHFETQIGVVNASDQATQVWFLAKPAGEPITWEVLGPNTQRSTTAQELFGPTGDAVEWAVLEAEVSALAAVERFVILPERDRMAALGLGGRRSDRLIFVHVAEDVDRYWTGLVWINAGEDVLDVTRTYHDRDGHVLQQDCVALDAGMKHTQVFDAHNRQPLGTAWVEVRAQRPDLLGIQLFGSTHGSAHRFFAGLSACTEPAGELIFPVLQSSSTTWTGLVTVNAGTAPADLVLEALDDSGAVLGRRVLERVPAGGKRVMTAGQLFDAFARTSGTWIRATSDAPSWVGACLWGDLGEPRQRLSGVIAMPRPDLYLPPLDSPEWETISPEALGWNTQLIPAFLAFLEDQHTRAFLVLKNGKIALEHYAGTTAGGSPFDRNSFWYWASAGKTLAAALTGIAQEQGFLEIHDRTSDYLGQGWTSLSPEREARITIWHQLTMTTGLDDGVGDPYCTHPECLVYRADPGTRWAYHNGPYTLLHRVIAGATGQDTDAYFKAQIRDKIGMDGTWFDSGYNHIYASTARSMARFGLLILNRGWWDGRAILGDNTYFEAMTHTSQDLNQSYGYLWWLNGEESFMVPGVQTVFPGSLAPHAPDDLFAAMGANGQLLELVPSQNLIVVRMGDDPDETTVPFTFQDRLWTRLAEILAGPPKAR